MLILAFLCVGTSIGFTMWGLVSFRDSSQDRQNLLSEAQLIARSLPAEAHQQLNHRWDIKRSEYSLLRYYLSRSLDAVPNARAVFTLRRRAPGGTGAEFVRVLSVTASSESGHLMSGYAHPSATLRAVFDSGIGGTVDEADPTIGHVLTAFAPITNSSGDVVAALALQESAGKLGSPAVPTWVTLWPAIALLVALSVLLSSLIAQQFATPSPEASWNRSLSLLAKTTPRTILEMLLLALAIGVIGTGAYSFYNQQRSSEASVTVQQDIDALQQLDEAVATSERLGVLTSEAHRRANELEFSVTALRTAIASDATASEKHELFERLRHRIEADMRLQQDHRDDLNLKNDQTRAVLETTICVAALLALGALVLLRWAAAQQQDLYYAQMDSMRHQGAYRQVAENLPLGLFAFSEGTLRFTNKLWDKITNRVAFEDRMDALMRTVHPQDRLKLQKALEEAEKTRSAFGLQFRLVDPDGKVRYMDSQATAIFDPDGQVEHMLGFALDITPRVLAQQELEIKNKEVLAKNDQLAKALADIEDNFEAMVHGLVKAVEAKDPYTAGHSERVMGYATRVGQEMGLSATDLRILERGTLIHDIGKIGIPDALLTKPTSLTDEEYAVIKQHPMIGFRMIQGIPIFHECVPIVLWHHERMDGKGYPDQLSGDQIPLLVRIATVADCFDAMTSNRAYRQGMDTPRALSLLIEDGKNGALDSSIVDVLVKVVQRDGLLWKAADEAA